MEDYINHLDNILSSNGENILQNSGSVSHEKPVVKALAEYRKYQVKTLTPVEEAYLETLKKTQKKIGKKSSHGSTISTEEKEMIDSNKPPSPYPLPAPNR